MKIDFKATRQRMEMLRIPVWSERNGHNINTVRAILNGTWNAGLEAPKVKAVIDDLRRDGYLVEIPEDADEVKAA